MTNEEIDHLVKLSNQLLTKNQEALKHFETYRLNNEQADFMSLIKPFADDVHQKADEWMPLAVQFIRDEKPKYLHENQINDAHENIHIEAVTCFQADTKKKRFLERNKSIYYTIDSLLKSINE
ncbi:YppE family protein [Bacillus shivajii]|uniref:YppE family protein n=1 Tax=Bacillus shivajii TaxID=1983719 RepID=UPI001CF99F1E|nr:YppE family protein [Bacillus shivajii]UCZ54824.1 YppE family protein [Bacillus shivajii]